VIYKNIMEPRENIPEEKNNEFDSDLEDTKSKPKPKRMVKQRLTYTDDKLKNPIKGLKKLYFLTKDFKQSNNSVFFRCDLYFK